LQEFFDPQRVVSQPRLSLAAARCAAGTGHNKHIPSWLEGLARHYGFDIDTPWAELLPSVCARSCSTGAKARDRIPLPRRTRQRAAPTARLRGIMPNLERRWRESESGAVREELGRYRGHRPCPDCGGTRLNIAARAVLIDGRSIAELTRLTVRAALAHLARCTCPAGAPSVAERIVRDVVVRLRFLADVGIDTWGLDRAADTLSGGETQRIRLASQVGSGLTGVMLILDEPSIGCTSTTMRGCWPRPRLRDLGNTVTS